MKLEHYDACKTIHNVRMAYMEKISGRVRLFYATKATKDEHARLTSIPAPECYDYLIKEDASPASDDSVLAPFLEK